MRKGVSPPRAPVQKDKQTDDAISTTTWEATSTNRTERRRRSAKTKDDGKPKTPIEKLTIPPAPSPPNISDPTTTGKRKREATPEKTSKKLKASEEILEPNSSKEEGAQDSEEQPELEICPMCGEEYDPEDEDEDTVCEFHPGKSAPGPPLNTSPLEQLFYSGYVRTLTSLMMMLF